MRSSKYFFLLFLIMIANISWGQDDLETQKVKINGQVYTAVITATDTLLLANLDDISITAPRKFDDYDEYLRYLRFRRYANIVYPYAVRAVKTYHDLQDSTKNLSKRKKKRVAKRLQRRLEKELKGTLKKMTKQQGYILTKMIEKELDMPLYQVVKDFRGPFTATYWSSFGRLFGYNIREGYIKGKDEILDIVLKDFDISYEQK